MVSSAIRFVELVEDRPLPVPLPSSRRRNRPNPLCRPTPGLIMGPHVGSGWAVVPEKTRRSAGATDRSMKSSTATISASTSLHVVLAASAMPGCGGSGPRRRMLLLAACPSADASVGSSTSVSLGVQCFAGQRAVKRGHPSDTRCRRALPGVEVYRIRRTRRSRDRGNTFGDRRDGSCRSAPRHGQVA